MILNQYHDEVEHVDLQRKFPVPRDGRRRWLETPRQPDHQSREAGSNGCAEFTVFDIESTNPLNGCGLRCDDG
jgi:hypothetical protein